MWVWPIVAISFSGYTTEIQGKNNTIQSLIANQLHPINVLAAQMPFFFFFFKIMTITRYKKRVVIMKVTKAIIALTSVITRMISSNFESPQCHKKNQVTIMIIKYIETQPLSCG